MARVSKTDEIKALHEELNKMRDMRDRLREQHSLQLDRADQMDRERIAANDRLREANEEVARLRHEVAMAHRETSKWKRAMAAVAETNHSDGPLYFGAAELRDHFLRRAG